MKAITAAVARVRLTLLLSFQENARGSRSGFARLTHKDYDQGRWKRIAAVELDKAKYRKLVANALPAVVVTEAENERLLAFVEPMMRCELSPEEARLFDLLVKLIEDFEQRHYPMGQGSPHETLKFLMEQRGLRQHDIAHLLGSSGVASEVVNGKRAMSKKQAKALAEFFSVSPELFI